jgi:hypothetical protein
METTEGDDMRLQTTGMLHLQAVDQAGNPVQLANAGIKVGTTDATTATVSASLPNKGYELDDVGRWAPQTSTTATGADLIAQQSGFWNADRAYRTACVIGHLSAPKKSCGGERVKAGGLDGIYTQDTADADGQFCLAGPQGRSQPLSVGSSTRDVTFPSTAGDCRNPARCADIGQVQVDDADCPVSCDVDQTDAPGGCGTGQGSTGPAGCEIADCSIGGLSPSALEPGGCCTRSSTQILSCADACSGWYECKGSIYGPCTIQDSTYTTCLSNAATAALNACPGS